MLVLIAFIVACISASKLKEAGGGGNAAGFAAVWTAILLFGISVFGTIVMRKYQTPLMVGGFLGVIFIMTNQMLILFVLFADYAKNSTATVAAQSSDVQATERAMSAFSFFLFIVYGLFGSLLAIFRSDIIKNAEDDLSMEQETGSQVNDVPPDSV